MQGEASCCQGQPAFSRQGLIQTLCHQQNQREQLVGCVWGRYANERGQVDCGKIVSYVLRIR